MVLLCITNNSIKDQSFVYTQLNDQTVLFQTIQFSMSHLFPLSLNAKEFYLTLTSAITPGQGWPRGVMVKAMDWEIVVSEFELQSYYYVHFRKNTLGKGMNPLILPAIG